MAEEEHRRQQHVVLARHVAELRAPEADCIASESNGLSDSADSKTLSPTAIFPSTNAPSQYLKPLMRKLAIRCDGLYLRTVVSLTLSPGVVFPT